MCRAPRLTCGRFKCSVRPITVSVFGCVFLLKNMVLRTPRVPGQGTPVSLGTWTTDSSKMISCAPPARPAAPPRGRKQLFPKIKIVINELPVTWSLGGSWGWCAVPVNGDVVTINAPASGSATRSILVTGQDNRARGTATRTNLILDHFTRCS